MNAESTSHSTKPRKNIVVIGNGMVGLRFCERLLEFDIHSEYQIITFGEEPRAAYDRVGLTSFFAHRDAEQLMLARKNWYEENGIELHIGVKVDRINRKKRIVHADNGVEIPYDVVILATGSYPFVPPVPGIDKIGVFVYRTIEDLQRIIGYGRRSERAAVIGGGLLGLEAAKATYDLGLETHVVEFSPRLMPRQVDEAGSKTLVKKIEALGVHVHLNKGTKEVTGMGVVEGMTFHDGDSLDVDMIVVSAGIRPRDELASGCGLEVGERGGIVVNDKLQTSDPNIFAVGEVALHGSMIYGLVAPGYDMAEIVAANLTGDKRIFAAADLSTKLKLMGIDVASFGDYSGEGTHGITYEDPIEGVYKKLFFSEDGKYLRGGILVGDAADYGTLSIFAKSGDALPCKPGELLVGSGNAAALGSVADMPENAQICSCAGVTKGAICSAIRNQELGTLDEVKSCTKAGTGCGGCMPLVTDLFKNEMKVAGKTISTDLCPHFAHTRQELLQVARVKQLRTFSQMMDECGNGGDGCEICKPTVASILASLFNENVLDHAALQDTNDRFLANIQRGGTYSVIPRVPGGELSPEKLVVIGEVAREFGLYTKITGSQRIALFGAPAHQLPDIWERLIAAGFESGHAYGKALRMVKSCVGSTWCRFGIGDSVGFAIRLEERYRGLRAPHKLKSAVSGCIRECAEAQCKDFGLIATENGYNLYVGGNGGAHPRHADLLASDLDEETCIRYIDRFLMYYIQIADKLTRTSVWMDKLEGGIEHLREVVIEDKLGICETLEEQMNFVVETYSCEWAEVVNNPERRAWFRQFVNTDETQTDIEIVPQRDQHRPADWPADEITVGELTTPDGRTIDEIEKASESSWIRVGNVTDFPANAGAPIKYGDSQIAVFNYDDRNRWYASQNMCPHKRAFVLSRGLTGDANGTPKISCPMHKKNFSLETGSCLSDERYSVAVFPVKVEGESVFVELPPSTELDQSLATDRFADMSCEVQTV